MPQVINTVTKAAPTDNYPVVRDIDLSGSYRIVANLTERDAIVSTQRKQSMLVFVISDLHFYQLQSDLLTWTDLGLSLGGGFAPPIVRYVYLVQDASDATRMGGTANNTYTTFQTAYDAANALQVLLGGVNRVVISVGNTTAGIVGNLSLSANWNQFVHISGISRNDSSVGTITTTGLFTVTNLFISNASIGNITAEAGITVLAQNSNVGSLNTTSLTGSSGNIFVTNCSNSSIGGIVSSSSLGNVGTLLFSNCNAITVGGVSMTQTSTTASFSIGAFTMTNCDSCRFTSTVTITMAFATSTGTIGGLSIGSSNQDILFTGNVRITGYANNTNTPSDVVISNILCYNCTFGGLFINYRIVGFSSWEGGTITTLIFQKCFFRSRVRIGYNVTTPVITGTTFRITDCQILGSTDGTSLDFYVLTSEISFDSFVMQGIESNFRGLSDGYDGIAIANDVITTPTVPFTVDGVSAIFSNINAVGLLIELYNPTTANSTYDAIFTNVNTIYALSLQIAEGDINFKVLNSDTITYYLVGLSVTPPIKRTELIGCNFNTDSSDLNFYGQVPVTLKNTYFGYYTNVGNPLTQDIISYNSFIESFSETGSVTTWTGTLNTSTLRRLVTDSILAVTFNNSYDESY